MVALKLIRPVVALNSVQPEEVALNLIGPAAGGFDGPVKINSKKPLEACLGECNRISHSRSLQEQHVLLWNEV